MRPAPKLRDRPLNNSNLSHPTGTFHSRQQILVNLTQFVLKKFGQINELGRLSESICCLFSQFMHEIEGKGKRVWQINENLLCKIVRNCGSIVQLNVIVTCHTKGILLMYVYRIMHTVWVLISRMFWEFSKT